MKSSELARSTPEAEGVPSEAVDRWLGELEKLDAPHGFQLVRHGRIVAEGNWRPYRPELRHQLFSLSKSFTSCAFGLARAEFGIGLDDRAADFFPELSDAIVDGRMRRVTLRNLLTMSSGHAECTLPLLFGAADGDWVRAFLGSRLETEPGTRFVYNSGATYLVAAVLRRVTGMTLTEYLRPRLFDPLGIPEPRWDCCPRGIECGGWGLWLTTAELARFGQLLLRHGVWAGRQLIPRDYLELATAAQIDNSANEQPDWKLGYGFQFWRSAHGFRGDGACGQYMVVIPELDLVLAANSGLSNMQTLLSITWDTLLPHLAPAPLPEAPEARRRLAARIAGLAVPPEAGDCAGAPAADAVYRIDGHAGGLRKLAFAFDASGVTLDWQWADRRESLRADFGRHCENRLRLVWPEAHPAAVSAARDADGTLRIRICWLEAPYRDTLVCRFAGGRLTVERRQHLDFLEAPWPECRGVRLDG